MLVAWEVNVYKLARSMKTLAKWKKYVIMDSVIQVVIEMKNAKTDWIVFLQEFAIQLVFHKVKDFQTLHVQSMAAEMAYARKILAIWVNLASMASVDTRFVALTLTAVAIKNVAAGNVFQFASETLSLLNIL